MLKTGSIFANSNGVEASECESLSCGSTTAYWDGLLYSSDGEFGSKAVRSLIDSVAAGSDAVKLTTALRGNFFLVVYDTKNNDGYACVDSTGMFAAFRSADAISRSYQKLFDRANLNIEQLDLMSCMEVLQLGTVSFQGTTHPEIKRIAGDEFITLSGSGVTVSQRPIPRINDTPLYKTLTEAILPFADSIRGKELAIDMTGGFDSRLIAALLSYHGINFRSGISSYKGHIDEILGRQVASEFDSRFVHTVYDPASLNEDLISVLHRLNGLTGGIGTSHRLAKLCEARHLDGIEVGVKGIGGEIFKDFFWTQDFPYYRQKKSRLGVLHRLRIEFELLSRSVLTDSAFEIFQSSRDRRLQGLQKYVLTYNTQTYDNYYIKERIPSNGLMTTSCQFSQLPVHSPFCELELAQLGFSEKGGNGFISKCTGNILRILTGGLQASRRPMETTALSGSLDKIKDGYGYSSDKARKLYRKLTQVYLNKTAETIKGADINSAAMEIVCSSEAGAKALYALKQFDIVREDVNYSDISPRFRGNFVSLGWFIHTRSSIEI